MYIVDKLNIDIQNLTTTTAIDSRITTTLESFNDNNDMTYILSYALPISCFVIMMVLMLVVGIQRRQRILEKWTSLKRMKNTDPRFHERSGLRRDSEYESPSTCVINVSMENEDDFIPDYKLATIT
jgi:hypothetical protein